MFPIHISIGTAHLVFYEGLYFALSILLGLLLGSRKLEKDGLKEEQYLKVLFIAILGSLVGGRLFHIVFWGNDYYLRNPGEILALWKGGISITGGIAGALVAAAIVCKASRQSFFRYLAILAPIILISQGLGRIGCFLNGDAFGLPTNLPWGVEFQRFGTTLFSMQKDLTLSSPAWLWCHAHGLVNADSIRTVTMHPTQLYEALFDWILAGVLIFMNRKKVSHAGVGFLYVGAYSLFRFGVEYIRGDREEILALNTSFMQFFLLGTGILFVILAVVKGGQRRRG